MFKLEIKIKNDATKTFVSAFMLPKLDYCNSIFYGSPMYVVERLWKVENRAARQIFKHSKQIDILPLLTYLHWLPIMSCIDCKLSVICHSFFLGCLLFTCLIYYHSTHPREIYARLLTMEFYIFLSCEQRHLGIIHFLLQPLQYGNFCLWNSETLILSRNFSQH